MKIKKHGKTFYKEKDDTEKFVCENCGCEFECKEDEYYNDRDNLFSATTLSCSCVKTDTLVCSCPECHKIVLKKKDRPITNPVNITVTGDTNTNVTGLDIKIGDSSIGKTVSSEFAMS